MNLIHTLYAPQGDGPFPTVMALHGWGASAQDLLGLAPFFPPGLLTLCPQGTTTLSVGPGMEGYGWFPLVPGQPPEPRAFRQGSQELKTFFEEAQEQYPIAEGKCFALGFSQGGLMAYDLVLRDPSRFAGLVALSSWLPQLLAANLPQLETQRDFPVLVIHGTEDAQIDIAKARESKEHLEQLGVALEYHELSMGHEIRPEGLKILVQWLQRHL